MIKLIPTWAYLAVIGALSGAVGVQQVRIANVRTDLAHEQSARSTETATREQMALGYTAAVAKLQSKHASEQQLKENDYAVKIKTLETAKSAGAAVAGQLRDKLAAFTTRDRRPGETDAIAIERAADRFGVIGSLLAESIDLVTEGRSVVERRDAEVGRLLEQIRIDRAACSTPSLITM